MKTTKIIIITGLFIPLAIATQVILSSFVDHPRQDDPKITIVEVPSITYIGLEAEVDASNADAIAKTMGKLYAQLTEYSKTSGTETVGKPIAVYNSLGRYEIEVTCGLPVNKGHIIHHESITVGETLAGKAVKAIHEGGYGSLPFTHKKVNEYIEKNNLQVVGRPYEIYQTGYGQGADTVQWRTEVYYPLGR